MTTGFKMLFRRLDKGTRVGPGLPSMPTHESMLLEHIKREQESRIGNRNWERRFHR